MMNYLSQKHTRKRVFFLEKKLKMTIMQTTMQTPFELKPEIKNWDYVTILFYKYVLISNPEQFRDEQRALCERLAIKGRFAIATEGINGTCEGTPDAINEYVKHITSDVRFADMHFKYSKGTGISFPKLKIRVRPEIVSLGLGDEDFNPAEFTAPHLKPEELHEWFTHQKDFVIVDMRNDYEHQVGHFPNSVLPSMKYFRELPQVLPELESLKDKTVLTVCTGGIRCEKASGYLLKKGFKDVHQLDGGMVSYMEKYPGQNFLGAMYTFDNRLVTDYDGGNHPIIGICKGCGSKTENIIDCKNNGCHGQLLQCQACIGKHGKMYCGDRCNMHLSPFKRFIKRIVDKK
jgi:UPF0176 protein